MSDDGRLTNQSALGAERILHQLVDSIPDYAIFMLDPEGHVATWNVGATRLKGYAASEIIGRHFSIFYTPEDIAAGKPARILETVRQNGHIEDESWRVRKDGTRFWGNVVITALKNESGELMGFVKVTRDLTARKLVEEELRRSEERFRLLVDSVLDYAIYMLDPEGLVTTWNSGAERMTGYPADEVIGQNFELFFPEEEARLGQPLAELASAERTGRFQDETCRVKRNGTHFWASVTITPIRGPHAELIGFATVTRDLTVPRSVEETERKLLAEQVARAASQESEGQLKEAAARADTANRLKDEFLATVSHELRTPLNAIVGWSSLLRARTDDPALVKGLASIHQNALAQARLIEDILDVSRIITGKLRLHLTSANPVALVEDAIEVIRPSADAKQIAIQFSRPDEPIVFLADTDRLRQIAWNLLSNAVKFTEPGGKIDVSVKRSDHSLELVVRDNGRGIEPEFLPHVFERFRQADSTTTRRFGGLGLGLAIVRHIAELHGGEVTVESDGLGQGALFRVTLPIRPIAVEAEERASENGPSRTHNGARRHTLAGFKVLIVDDDLDAREVLEDALSSAGAAVKTADSAAKGLELVRSFRPSVIVSDVGMPEQDGYAFMRHVRELGTRQGGDVPSIALTGYTRHGDRTLAIAAGFTAHVAKPVVPEELLKLVASLAADARRQEASSE
jgi:PAS domain S-box-containing protein